MAGEYNDQTKGSNANVYEVHIDLLFAPRMAEPARRWGGGGMGTPRMAEPARGWGGCGMGTPRMAEPTRGWGGGGMGSLLMAVNKVYAAS